MKWVFVGGGFIFLLVDYFDLDIEWMLNYDVVIDLGDFGSYDLNEF